MVLKGSAAAGPLTIALTTRVGGMPLAVCEARGARPAAGCGPAPPGAAPLRRPPPAALAGALPVGPLRGGPPGAARGRDVRARRRAAHGPQGPGQRLPAGRQALHGARHVRACARGGGHERAAKPLPIPCLLSGGGNPCPTAPCGTVLMRRCAGASSSRGPSPRAPTSSRRGRGVCRALAHGEGAHRTGAGSGLAHRARPLGARAPRRRTNGRAASPPVPR
jgi:hypothetical protein